MLTAALAVLCALLVLVLLVQRPAIWPVLVVLAVLWFALFGVFRYRVRSWVARWVCGGSFEKSKTQFSLEPLSQPAALLSGETVLWYNTEFRTRLMKGEALLVPRVQKVLPGLDLQEARKVSGQLLNLADGVWSAHSSTVPGEAESMTLLVLNEETALRKVEAEYKASRPGYLVFLVDGYDDVFSDMLDSERARLLEGINRVLEDMIGRGTGFLRRVASGRYIAVVEERQLAYDNWETTDDHGMLIYGIAKDQEGNEYYMVKNSWGEAGKYKGLWYASKAFVRYKTMNIIVHKDALPKDIAKKLGIK